MSPVLHAFPQRALQLKPAGSLIAAVMLVVLSAAAVGGGLAWIGLGIVPGIRSDFEVRETAGPSPQARLVTGNCRSRAMIFHDCDATLSAVGKSGPVTRQVNYVFLDFHSGSRSVRALVDARRPELVTTDLALETLWNRVAVAAGLVFVLIVILYGVLQAARKSGRDRRAVAALSGRALKPAAVQFLGWGPGHTWRVSDEAGNVFEWPVRRSDKPFVIDAARGLMLALREAPGAPAYPMDEKLRLVDLSASEKHRIWAARDAAAAQAAR